MDKPSRDCSSRVCQAATSLDMQGLDWILRMYSEGTCPDYRWTYDAYGPSAGQLAAELSSKQQEGEAEQVAASTAKSEHLLACLVDLLRNTAV